MDANVTHTSAYVNTIMGRLITVSIVEEGHMTYPDEDEIRELFGEK